MARNTRATALTDMESLKAGFGVFAYDQGVNDIITFSRGNVTPNFMFNTWVHGEVDIWKMKSPITAAQWGTITDPTVKGTYSLSGTEYVSTGEIYNTHYLALSDNDKSFCEPSTFLPTGGWQYSPIKYWPNNPGNKVSFFAYAPYNENIKSLSGSPRLVLERDNVGPAIYYNALVSDLDQALDLCWGSNATQDITDPTLNTELAPVDYIKNPATGTPQNVSVSSKIKFNFKHALSRLKFNVQIFNDIITDGEHHGTPANGGSIDANSTIEIKSLKLVGYLATEGTLSLYNGKWINAQYETRELELLPYLATKTFTGATASQEVDLFGAGKYLTILPDAQYKILIEYWVSTNDPAPGAHPLNSTVTKNIIESPLEYTLEQGKAYEYHLNLGMTTVKFDAVVTNWNEGNNHEVDLPNNTLEVVSTIPDFGSQPYNMGAEFMGVHTTNPSVASSGKFYWNSTTSTLMQSTGMDAWAEAGAGDYLDLGTNKIYTKSSSTWKAKEAAKFIAVPTSVVPSGRLMLTSTGYVSIAQGTYSTLKALLAANPDTGLYNVGTTTYFYQHH